MLAIVDASFDPVDVRVVLPELPLNLLSDVRVDQVVDQVVMLHLILCDEAHVEKPILVIQVLKANAAELFAIDRFIFIIVVLTKLVSVGFFYIIFFNFAPLEISIIPHTHLGKHQKVCFF